MKTIKEHLCSSMHKFVKEHIDEVENKKNFWCESTSYAELGFKNRNDMLKQIKTDVEQAYWALTELCAWGMDKNYCEELFVADMDDEIYTIFTIDGRYFRFSDDDVIEVIPKTKFVEIKVWEDKV